MLLVDESIRLENMRREQEYSRVVKQLARELDELAGCADAYGAQPLDNPVLAVADDMIPEELRDPMTQKLLVDPVACADGLSYERRHLQHWLCSHDTSPLTGALLAHRSVVPNIQLRALCERFLQLPLDTENPDGVFRPAPNYRDTK